MGEVISVELTRIELVALKETIELAPGFEGRAKARDAIRGVLRERRRSPAQLSIDEGAVAALARHVLPIDVPSSALQAKLKRALERNRQLSKLDESDTAHVFGNASVPLRRRAELGAATVAVTEPGD